MKQFYLVETVTKDKLIHQGIFFKPQKPGRKALLWVHGLTSTFYSSRKRLETFADACEKNSLGFAAFNNRGHDILTGIKKVDKRKASGTSYVDGGAGVENFAECIFDIDAGIDFLVTQGFSEIVLIGQSTGANKVCFYAGNKKHKNLFAVVLASPTSDRYDPALNQNKLHKDLNTLQELVNKGKGNEIITGFHMFPATPKRILSSLTSNSLEDTFDYGDERPRLTFFSKIKKPLLIIIGDQDEYLDRPATEVIKVFNQYQHSTNYKGVILPNTSHSYNGKEKEFVTEIIQWYNSI